ncbi:MAG: hypothetical protein DRQ88_04020 [Epsilonproteobacteria bacterium]|nr:MAG: hypothetical protein DRQ89_04325 [Campylobacterota bacterium]RLA67201.1 MAG: hypothetical protein DRQ88_04020 [Campylobacterota bacterium]
MKLLIVLLLLISCGKPPADPDPSYPGLITYNVPTKYYNKYKAQLDWVESDIVSLTGKHLVRFVSYDDDPQITTMYEGLVDFKSSGEGWLFFKEEKDQFTNVGDSTAGRAYIGSASRPLGVIVMNFTNSMLWTGGQFRQVLNHEILHNFGFTHTSGSDHSIMNYRYVYKTRGVTDLDTQRLADAFPFSMAVVSIKDLEKIGAAREDIDSNKYATFLAESYGLSESRAQTISKYLLSYRKLASMRDLTAKEKDLLSHEILGFGFKKGKDALETHLQGDQNSLDDLILKAADKNEISPEHVKELFGELFI